MIVNKKIKWIIAIISSFSVAFILILAVFFKFLPMTEVLYYQPVIDNNGKNIAYIKRSLNYYFTEIKITFMPFMQSPPAVKVMRDCIQLCKRNRDTNREFVLIEWKIPLEMKNKLGSIAPELDWHGKDLKYNITLQGYGDIGLGTRKNGPSGLEWVLTNLKEGEGIAQGPIKGQGVHVELTNNPERIRFPRSNKIIIERVDDQVK